MRRPALTGPTVKLPALPALGSTWNETGWSGFVNANEAAEPGSEDLHCGCDER